MFVMVKNPNDTFQKLCVVQANKAGRLSALRGDVEQALPGKLQGRRFILLDETMSDVGQAQEAALSLTEVYHSDCVMIRWVEEIGECSWEVGIVRSRMRCRFSLHWMISSFLTSHACC